MAGDDAAGLDRLGRAALRAQLLAQHDMGFGEGALDVPGPVGRAAGDVRVGIVMDQRGARLRRRRQLDRGRLRRVVDRDQIERVLAEIAALRDDQGDSLADEANLARRERPVGARCE